MSTSLTFLGATGTVTGSRYLVEHGGRRLLVDCGLFQGYKQLRLRNWAQPPFDPAAIDAVVLTHAHIDHSGWLPRLVKLGFRGPIHATSGTTDLCTLLLPDAARIQEEDAQYANEAGFSRHRPALPLYTEQDARECLGRFRVVPFGKAFTPIPGLAVTLQRAGHLLGAAAARIANSGGSTLFSGDVGRRLDPIMPPPEPVGDAETIVVESTYGDRSHPPVSPEDELAPVLARVAARGGVAVIPTFAVGRAQSLLLTLARLKAAHRIPDVPVYLDSPRRSTRRRSTCAIARTTGSTRRNARRCGRQRSSCATSTLRARSCVGGAR